MKKLSETYKELGIDFKFPIIINDANGNRTYRECSYGYWFKREYNSDGNVTYYENSNGCWIKREYDANGNRTYYENSKGCWTKREYDARGNETYYKDSNGFKRGTPKSQSCDGKVVEIDGKKYELKLKHEKT